MMCSYARRNRESQLRRSLRGRTQGKSFNARFAARGILCGDGLEYKGGFVADAANRIVARPAGVTRGKRRNPSPTLLRRAPSPRWRGLAVSWWAAAWFDSSLLVLFFHRRGLVGGDDLVRDHLRNNVVVRHFHGIRSSPLGHGREVGSVRQHFRQRHLGFHYG